MSCSSIQFNILPLAIQVVLQISDKKHLFLTHPAEDISNEKG